ncbi:6308_t:CDS:2 [Acaulospora morrowiae]|uniref:6308_t:CDS:1 n=1 Tax=Acaulospora morrowiae TaxID=94023 RepID=A0A9N9FI21_9GLOM|nr:6308_t:CDS:2 [Acaulospora morrowiae]
MSSFSTLLNPIPQYATGSLPALAIMGESPVASFSGKFMWLLRCLGCPFTGLFYSFIIGGLKEDRCVYWLSSNKFKLIHKESDESGHNKEFPEPYYRPFGFYAFGTLALISQAQGTVNCNDWPHIPSLLSWAVPATLIRAIYGVVLIKNPDDIVNEHQITIAINDENRTYKRFTVLTTAFASIFYPWITFFLRSYPTAKEKGT